MAIMAINLTKITPPNTSFNTLYTSTGNLCLTILVLAFVVVVPSTKAL